MAMAEQVDPVEVARNPWGVVLHHEDWQALELRWLPVELSDADTSKRH
jgi:extradiol dioxygenase family protein